MVKLILAMRYVALFGLIVAILLIIIRAKLPAQDTSQGTIHYWRGLWSRLRERRDDQSERANNLKALRGKTVLLVDPDSRSARVMSWRLESLKCRILATTKGSKGLSLAANHDVQLVIVDALLSDMSAQDFYRSLSRQDIPVIFVGVLENQYDQLRHLGANTRCFGKPYNPDEILALAGHMLQNNEIS